MMYSFNLEHLMKQSFYELSMSKNHHTQCSVTILRYFEHPYNSKSCKIFCGYLYL